MPNPPPKQTEITISLKECKCLKFALTNYGHSNKAKIEVEQYEFALSLSLTPNHFDKQISIRAKSQLFEDKNARLKLELAEIQVACMYFIQNFDDLIPKDRNSNLIIPDSLIQLCSSITLGIVRGMFAIKLEKTLYANALLPLVEDNLLTTITAVDL